MLKAEIEAYFQKLEISSVYSRVANVFSLLAGKNSVCFSNLIHYISKLSELSNFVVLIKQISTDYFIYINCYNGKFK